MKSIFNREFVYDIDNSAEYILEKIRENTIENNNYYFTNKHNSTKFFVGTFNNNTFQIKTIIDAFPIKRELFNPIIYGIAEEINGITKLHIKMKCRRFDLFFGVVLLILCFFSVLFIGVCNYSLVNLLIYMTSIPFILIFLGCLISMNFRDAKERIESIVFYAE